MRTTRVCSASVVFGATLAAAVWVYTYRVWNLVEYIDPLGRRFHASERVGTQPWWSVPATVALTLAGAGVSLWLLPERRRLIKRFSSFVKPS